MNTKLNTSFKIICSFLIFALVSLSFYNALSLGFSWDEIFHHINGLLRFNYLVSLGKFQEYNYSNNKYYPGLYDTISYFIGNIFEIINNKFYNIYIVEIKHLINLFFSLGSLIGLYLITKIIFNKCISILAVIITFTNPFFFGHTSINPKVIIIFFSIIWFCYFFYKYFFFEKKNF